MTGLAKAFHEIAADDPLLAERRMAKVVDTLDEIQDKIAAIRTGLDRLEKLQRDAAVTAAASAAMREARL
jgi:hypothetical protein